MSILMDKLEKVGQNTPSPMGFEAALKRHSSVTPIMLIGQVKLAELAKNPRLSNAQVDAILLSIESVKEKSFRKTANSLKGRLWGAHVSRGDEHQIKTLKDRGCDFIVFDADHTPAALLNDAAMGNIIAIGPDLNEDVARAIHELPIDGVLFTPQQSLFPLTVQKLIDIQLVRGLIDKPFIMETPPEIDPTDLETLHNAEIAGLVVSLSSLDAIAKTKEAIPRLPRRKSRPRAAAHLALVPNAPTEFGASDQDEGDGDDDEDTDF